MVVLTFCSPQGHQNTLLKVDYCLESIIHPGKTIILCACSVRVDRRDPRYATDNTISERERHARRADGRELYYYVFIVA
jgi:hypothetical protein